jgi:hypothetical protein
VGVGVGVGVGPGVGVEVGVGVGVGSGTGSPPPPPPQAATSAARVKVVARVRRVPTARCETLGVWFIKLLLKNSSKYIAPELGKERAHEQAQWPKLLGHTA